MRTRTSHIHKLQRHDQFPHASHMHASTYDGIIADRLEINQRRFTFEYYWIVRTEGTFGHKPQNMMRLLSHAMAFNIFGCYKII